MFPLIRFEHPDPGFRCSNISNEYDFQFKFSLRKIHQEKFPRPREFCPAKFSFARFPPVVAPNTR